MEKYFDQGLDKPCPDKRIHSSDEISLSYMNTHDVDGFYEERTL